MTSDALTETDRLREAPLSEALSERYLAYAMSTIVSRSLPDVRDGLKPVHRRLLYAMRQLRLNPRSSFKKCARVVGDVIGKYHPHGDSAVYDALVRLSQDFAVRYPLVEGQGNFGNIDGDNAAAMRYTESRMTEFAQALMEGLDENAVDFRATYDGEEEEPLVMPAAVPNFLANGASGIAVGMATNTPPHNLAEVCDAALYLLRNPECDEEALLKRMPGPDFPTGGVLVESAASIREAYRKGRGSFQLRGRWEKEPLGHGLYQIVITEIPYQVQKARLIEKIADLLLAKKLPLLADVRDESTEDVRIVLEPRSRTVNAEQLMTHLFRQTDLEVKISLNMNVLNADGVPGVMGLKGVLTEWLHHRRAVLKRRSRHRLEKIETRLEVLDGYLVAYLNLDEVIRIIREEDEAKLELIKVFSVTENQADAILNMRLKALRKLEEEEIRAEHGKLSEERDFLKKLLSDEEKQVATLEEEIGQQRTQFSKRTALGRRRTEIRGEVSEVEVPIEMMVEREPITVLLSEKGWIRAVKGHADPSEEFRFKDGDSLRLFLHVQTTDKIVILGTSGRIFTISADRLPRGRGYGEPLRLMVDLSNAAEVAAINILDPQKEYLVATEKGRGFVVSGDSIEAQTRAGKQILSVREGDKARFFRPVSGDHVALVGTNRKLLVFDLTEIPRMGRSKGVILQRYKEAHLSDIQFFNAAEGFRFRCGNGVRTETDLLPWLGHRAQVGRQPPTGFPRRNTFF